MNEEWLSAHLDGELDDASEAEVVAALAADPELAAAYDELAQVRALLRNEMIELPLGSIERIMDAVGDADHVFDGGRDAQPMAPVVSLASRRRVPTFAAAAAAMVIIASVVGGVGGANSLPAIGDLIEQHEVAAAVVDGAPMPDDMDNMVDVPMDEAMAMAPSMPDDLSMAHAFADGPTLHLVYVAGDGEAISVFRHEGEADLEELGAGSLAESGQGDMWSGPTEGAYVAVVDGTGFVWIVISETPHDDMMDDMMDDLPTRTPSLGERMRETADTVVDSFRFWN